MKWHRNDARGGSKRWPLLRRAEQLRQSRADVRLTFQPQDRRAQRAFIHANGARRCEVSRIATPAAHTLALIRRHLSERERAAFPTTRLHAREDARRLPTSGARGRISAPLN